MGLVLDGKLPLKSSAILDVPGRKYSLELNNIMNIQNIESHKGRRIGTWTGMFLDIGYLAFCIIGAILISKEGVGDL